MPSVSVSVAGTELTTYSLRNVTDTDMEALPSDQATSICQWIMDTVICQLIDVFGIGTNIINMMCFIKQGFKDSVNVSLFGRVIHVWDTNVKIHVLISFV